MKDSFSKPFLQIAAAIVCLVVAVGVGVCIARPWYKNIKMEVTEQPNARVVSVSAEGKITAKPDIAILNFSVVTQATTVKDVTRQGNEKMTKVIAALKALKIDAKDIRTSQYNLQPEYRYDNTGRPPTITGYRLDQQVTVKVRNLEMVETALQNGLDAGANQLGQLSFDIDDPSALKAEAREKAFDTAREKAESMAKAAGVRLGRVVTFSENEGYMPIAYANYRMEAKDMAVAQAAPAPTIESGSQELSINVTITYEIE